MSIFTKEEPTYQEKAKARGLTAVHLLRDPSFRDELSLSEQIRTLSLIDAEFDSLEDDEKAFVLRDPRTQPREVKSPTFGIDALTGDGTQMPRGPAMTQEQATQEIRDAVTGARVPTPQANLFTDVPSRFTYEQAGIKPPVGPQEPERYTGLESVGNQPPGVPMARGADVKLDPLGPTPMSLLEQNLLGPKAVIQGALSVAEGAGSSLEGMGAVMKFSPATAQYAETLKALGGTVKLAAEKLTPDDAANKEKIALDPITNPQVLVDPEWLTVQAGRAGGSMAAFLLPSVGFISKLGSGGLLSQSAAMSVMESLVNAGDTYDQAKKEGRPDSEAAGLFVENFAKDAPITAVLNVAGIFNPLIKNKLARTTAGAVSEPLQEVGQGVAQRHTLDQPLTQGMGAEIFGGLIGGGLGGAVVGETEAASPELAEIQRELLKAYVGWRVDEAKGKFVDTLSKVGKQVADGIRTIKGDSSSRPQEGIQDDTQNQAGLPGQVNEGQKPVPSGPDDTGGETPSPTDRVLQTQEEVVETPPAETAPAQPQPTVPLAETPPAPPETAPDETPTEPETGWVDSFPSGQIVRGHTEGSLAWQYGIVRPNPIPGLGKRVQEISPKDGKPTGRWWEPGGDPTAPKGWEVYTPQAPADETPTEAGEGVIDESAPDRKTQVRNLMEWVKERAQNRRSFNHRELENAAEQVLGGSRAKGTFIMKDVFDIMEAAVNETLHYFTNKSKDFFTQNPKLNFQGLRDMMQSIPTQTTRSKEQESLQQFSTPPTLAYLAGVALNPKESDVVLEPSAGTGSMVTMLRDIVKEVHVNEIDEKRRDLLEQQGYGDVTKFDAEHLDAMMAHEGNDLSPTAIIMNPPFSSTGGRVKRNKNKYGYAHVSQALARLRDGGRLVAILGRGAGMDAPNASEFWAKTKGKYNVRANIGLPGKEYTKYGTSFGTRLVIIDKNGPTQSAPVVGDFESLEEAYDAISTIAADRQEVPSLPQTQETPRPVESGTGEGGRRPTGPGTGPVRDEPTGGPGSTGSGRPVPLGTQTDDRGSRPGEVPAADGQKQPGVQPGTKPGGDREGVSGEGVPGSSPGPDSTGTRTVGPRQPTREEFEAKRHEILQQLADEGWAELDELLGGDDTLGFAATAKGPEARDAKIIAALAKGGAILLEKEENQNPFTWLSSMKEALGNRLGQLGPNPDAILGQVFAESFKLYNESATQKAMESFQQAEAPTEKKPQKEKKKQESKPPKEESKPKEKPPVLESEAVIKQAEKRTQEQDDSNYVIYQPTIEGADHPAQLVETRVMSSVDAPEINYQPNLPKDIPISAAQMESVARAGMMHRLRDHVGRMLGFLLGDGTGVGKGRQVASVIFDNWRSGTRKSVWISASAKLQDAAARDFADLGATDIAEWQTDEKTGDRKAVGKKLYKLNDWGAGEIVPKDTDGVMFLTYNTLISEEKSDEGQKRLEQLINWLGGDNADAVIVLDEAHKAKNAINTGGGNPTQTAERVIDIQSRMPNAKFVYASATFATEIQHMAYLERLGIWGEGTAFNNGFLDFMGEIGRGGVAALELVARELKALGRYLSRSISYKGVEFDEEIVELSEDQKAMYDLAARTWQKVLVQSFAQLKDNQASNNSRATARLTSVFWAAHQRFFRELLTAFKLPRMFEMIEEALDNDKSVVISMVDTGEARSTRAVALARELGGEVDLSPSEILINYIQKTYPVQQYQEVQNPDGSITSRPVLDEDGKPVLNPDAVRARNRLIREVRDGLRLPETPLDSIINTFGRERVAEITGRKHEVGLEKGTDKPTLVWRNPEGVNKDTTIINQHEMQAFQSGKKRIAVISKSGQEGISLHASLAEKNQQERLHFVLQLDWSADSQMQFFGRTHRSNQKQPPHYYILSTDIGGERRFSSTIARRLEALGALTKGQRSASGADVLAKYNFETDQGAEAAAKFYDTLVEDYDLDNPDRVVPFEGITGRDILEKMGTLTVHEDGSDTRLDDTAKRKVTTLLNRVLNLETGEQNQVWDYFFEVFNTEVAAAIEAGTLDLGVETIRGDSVRLEGSKVVHVDDETGAKTFRYKVVTEERAKPYPTEQVRHDVKEGGAHIYMPRNQRKWDFGQYGAQAPSAAEATFKPTINVAAVDSPGLVVVKRSTVPMRDARTGEVSHAYNLTYARHAPEPFRISQANLDEEYVRVDEPFVKQLELLREEVTEAESRLKHFRESRGAASTDETKQFVDEQIKGAKENLDRITEARREATSRLRDFRDNQQFEMWDSAVRRAASETFQNTHHVIGGSVLRIWNRLNLTGRQRMDIRMAYPDDAPSVVGIVLPEWEADQIEADLTGETTGPSARAIFRAIIESNQEFRLAGGARLVKRMLNHHPVVQIRTNNNRYLNLIQSPEIDVNVERIAGNYIFYLPDVDESVGKLEKILEQFPLDMRPGAVAPQQEQKPEVTVSTKDGQMRVAFRQKPGAHIRRRLQYAGFRYDGATKEWTASDGDYQQQVAEEIKEELAQGSGGGGFAGFRKPESLNPFRSREGAPVLPIKRSEILTKLSTALGEVPMRVGKFNQRAEGIYKIVPEVIRSRKWGDLQTLTHEIGHHVHKLLWGRVGRSLNSRVLRQYKEELEPLDYDQKRKQKRPFEGFAEFVRIWMFDPAEAKRLAPKFHDFFIKEIERKGDIGAALRAGQSDIRRWLEQSPEARIFASISKEPSQRRSWYQVRNFDEFYTEMVDGNKPIWNSVEGVLGKEEADKLPPEQHAGVLAQMLPGWWGKAAEFLEVGTFSPNDLTKANGEALRDILRRVVDRPETKGDISKKILGQITGENGVTGEFADKLDDLRVFVVAARALEKGFEKTGITHKDAMTAVDNLTMPGVAEIMMDPSMGLHESEIALRKVNHPLLTAALDLYGYQDRLLRYVVDRGGMSEEQYRDIKKFNFFFVPFFRVLDDAKFGGGKAASQKMGDIPHPVKRMHGSHREFLDPIESIIKNTYALISFAERNNVLSKLSDFADPKSKRYADGAAKWIEKVELPPEQIKINLQEIADEISAATGLEMDPTQLNAVATIFRPQTWSPKAGNILGVVKDGKREFYRVDPELYQALTRDDQSVNFLIRLAAMPTRLLRLGATGLNPDFWVKNLTRDLFTAVMQSEHGGYFPFERMYYSFNGLVQVMKARGHAVYKGIPDSEAFHEWRRAGGEHAAMISIDRTHLQETLKDLLSNPPQYLVSHPIEVAKMLGEATESATRVGEFMLAKKKGASSLGAGFGARTVTLDFSRRGVTGNFINMASAFYNARLQGVDVFLRMHSKRRAPRTVMRALANITIPSILLWLLNHDDPDYEELSQIQKDMCWNIPTRGTRLYEYTKFIPIPKPFLWGWVYGTPFERALDWHYKKDPQAFDGLAESILSEVSPLFSPTAIMPILEVRSGYSFFHGGSIEPEYTKGLPAQYRAKHSTTPFSIGAAKVLHDTGLAKAIEKMPGGFEITPINLDHVLFGYGAGAARTVTRLHQLLAPGDSPSPDLDEIPLIRAFVVRSPDPRSKSINQLYDRRQELTQKNTAYKYAKKYPGGPAQGAPPLTRAERIELGKLNRAAKTLSGYFSDWRDISYASKEEMSPDEKRDAAKAITYKMIDTARRALGKEEIERTGGHPARRRKADN